GQSLALSIPLHTTGDLKGPTFTLWSRGVTVAPIRTNIGDLPGFTASSIGIRITAPARIPPGLYPVTVQVRDQQNVRDVFRTQVEVVASGATATPTLTP